MSLYRILMTLLAAVCYLAFANPAQAWSAMNSPGLAESFDEPVSVPSAPAESLPDDARKENSGRSSVPSEQSANSATIHSHRPMPMSSGKLGLIAVYCGLIMLASAVGGYLPSIMKLTHTGTQTIISVVGGLMLGIALFHLLPHATQHLSIQNVAGWMMCGIVTMFLLIRWFHFHHHGPLEISTEKEEPCAGHDHDHDHDHDHEHDGKLREPFCHHAHRLSWMGIAVGLSLHTLIDGMALAASVKAPMMRPSLIPLAGFGTFLAILMHKPLDAVSITSLMASSGWKPRSRLFVNVLFALMCPIGAALFLMGVNQLTDAENVVICAALAFSAGVFLCISLSDLLPEMEFHSHNQVGLTLALLAGILLAYGVTFLQ